MIHVYHLDMDLVHQLVAVCCAHRSLTHAQDDGDWDTLFAWRRPLVVSGESEATVTWHIGRTTTVVPGSLSMFGRA